MKKVILSGKLGQLFGKTHMLDVRTPAEAVRALCANYADFQKHMINSTMGYKVLVDKTHMLDIQEVHNPYSQTFNIVPVVMGAKKGVLGVVLGVALIAASFWNPLGATIIAGYSATYASVAFSIGTSLLLGGITQLLSPQPKAPKPYEAAENNPSYNFNGPINTTRAGQGIPLGYGRLIVGSAVVSAGITSDDFVGA